MRRFVSKYSKACLNCLYYKSTLGWKPGLLHPVKKVSVLFHTFQLDHIGSFIRTENKNTKVLQPLMVLPSSASSNLYAVQRQNVTLRKCIYFSHFLSLLPGLGDKTYSKCSFNTQSEKCQRLNRTVLKLVSSNLCWIGGELWNKYVKKAQSSINCTINRSTKRSQSHLLAHRNAV